MKILLLMAVLLSGCGTVDPIDAAAHRKTYETISPEYLNYVAEDSNLDKDQKEIRFLHVRAWELQTRRAKEAAK